MNEQWNNALDQVKDEYLSEAASYRRKRHWPRVIGAVAAILVLIISWSVIRSELSSIPPLFNPNDTVIVDPGYTTAPSTTTIPKDDVVYDPEYHGDLTAPHGNQNIFIQFWEYLWDSLWDLFHSGRDDSATAPTTIPTTTTPINSTLYIEDTPDSSYFCYESYEELQRDWQKEREIYRLNINMMLPYFGDQPPEIQFISIYDEGGIPWTWYWTSYNPETIIRVATFPKEFSPGCSGTEAMYQVCPDAPNLFNREEYQEYYPQIEEITVTTSDGEKTALMKYSSHLDRHFLSFTQNGSLVTISGDRSILDPEWLETFRLVHIDSL